MKIGTARLLGLLAVGIAGLTMSGSCFAYTSSADAHKACDPTGVQYDASNKQFCCGTKGGCPALAAVPNTATNESKIPIQTKTPITDKAQSPNSQSNGK
jgi:hypothetical protein